MNAQSIIAREVNLAGLLREGSFNVPRHQRYYDWDKEHVRMLLQDLVDSVEEDRPCHFLGAIMLIKNEKTSAVNWEINDGQQRIITFSLICSYLCRVFQKQGRAAEESSILRVLFNIQEGHGYTLDTADELIPRVLSPINNKINFNNLLRGHEMGANGKMVAAWNAINVFLNEAEYQNLAWQKKLLYFMLHKVIVVRLEIGDSLDANAVFETLNSRGKSLEHVDLIKNYFLSFFNEDSKLVQGDTVYDLFENKIYASFKTTLLTSYYIRCHMQTQFGFMNKEQFFKKTRGEFGNPKKGDHEKVFEFVTDLARDNRIAAFNSVSRKSTHTGFLEKLTSDAKKSKSKRKIEDYLSDIQEYSITRPIVFSLFCRYLDAPKNEKAKYAKVVYNCTKILSSYVQRVVHVSDFRPSSYEERFANLAKDVNDKSCSTAKHFISTLKKQDKSGVFDDTQYIELMELKSYDKRLVKRFSFILRRIVEYQETNLRINERETTIEHILPKSPEHHSKPAWASKFDSVNCDRFAHCLGNLTVLGKGEDRSKAQHNESFSAKKKIYEKSTHKLTRDINKYKDWTPQTIKSRQSKLIKIAARDIWNFELQET